MSKKLYVGNISYNTTEEGLQDLFSEHGTVESVKIITDHATGRSKGFGFIEMESEDAAISAVESLNGSEFDGRNLKVDQAVERPRKRRF